MTCDSGDRYGVVLSNGDVLSAPFQEFPHLIIERARGAESSDERLQLIRIYCDFCYEELQESPSLDKLVPVVASLKDTGQQAELWWFIGVQLEKGKAWEDAATAYRHGLLLDPDELEASYFLNNNLGFCLNQLGDHEEAETFCTAALRITPARSNAYKNYGLALQGQGRVTKAALVFISGTEMCPEDGRGLQCLKELVAAHPEIREDLPAIDADIDRCEGLVPAH